jgi:sugar phosphate isomerase/epimerase
MQKTTLISLMLCVVNVCGANELKNKDLRTASGEHRTKRQFFAFDNGMNQIKTLADKAALLKELGYDGVGWRTGARAGDMIDALDKHGLRMISTYVGCKVDADNPTFDERLIAEIDAYKKHKTIVWLNVARGKNANDEIAVKLIQEIATLAHKAGLKLVLYPHVGCYVETVEDALRLAKKVNRPSVGMSFNLCHFLKTDDEKNLKSALKKAAPHLMLVSINGADSGNTKAMSWDRLIQPLGDGSYNNSKLLKILDEIGYTGPIGLQCYAVKGENRVNLQKSVTAWRELNK